MIVTSGETRISRSVAQSSASYLPPHHVTRPALPSATPRPTGRASLRGWRAWMADRIGWHLDEPAVRAWKWAEPEAALYRSRVLAQRLDALADELIREHDRPCTGGDA